jgi:Domain of unknown function (DUF4157)
MLSNTQLMFYDFMHLTVKPVVICNDFQFLMVWIPMHDHVKIRENSWLAWIAARKLGVPAVALTVGRTIHLYKTSRQAFLGDLRWVRHEMAHVEQFRRHGFWKFIYLYMAESVKKGYYLNKYEVEAREAETG